jgi:hypothetical protein
MGRQLQAALAQGGGQVADMAVVEEEPPRPPSGRIETADTALEQPTIAAAADAPSRTGRRRSILVPVVGFGLALIVIAIGVVAWSRRPAAETTIPPPALSTPVAAVVPLSAQPVSTVVAVPAGGVGELRISATADQRITGRVTLATSTESSVPLSLLLDGSPLVEKPIEGGGTIIDPTALPSNATYVLRIGPEPEANQATVEVVAQAPDATATGTIGGPPARLVLTEPHQQGVASFDGRAGQRVQGQWVWNGTDPRYASLGLFGPDGSSLDSWSALASGRSAPVVLPVDGAYTLRVTLDGDSIGSGDAAVVVAPS